MRSITLNKPLSQIDLETLGNYLEKNDLPNLIEIHGFCSAIISGPNMIMPSEWIRAIGISEVEFSSKAELEEVMSGVMAMYNDIAHQFEAGTFQVINPDLENQDDSTISIAKKLWIKSYMLGVTYDEDAWLIGDRQISELLFILSSVIADDEEIQSVIDQNSKKLTPHEIKKFRKHSENNLSEIANAIYQFWLSKRSPIINTADKASKIKRNDPCPCGSGKKFKKCCLH